MSLPVARRGEKEHLRYLWEGAGFDLEQACRDEGRNDALWAYAFWLHRRGECLPSDAALHRLVRRCNLATGYRNVAGEPERYTRHEARASVEQVSRYARSWGLAPLASRLRKPGKGWTPKMIVLADALAALAERTSGCTFTASYRQLSTATGIPLVQVAMVAAQLERARRAWRIGRSTPLPGRAYGTTIWSIRPPRPRQRLDEVCPPRYDARQLLWRWPRPSDRGKLTPWLFARRAQRSLERSVPNVLISHELHDLEQSEVHRSSPPDPPRAFRSP